jgi:hypothetical protein
MAYKYLVKTYSWESGTIRGNIMEFLTEEAAVNYAKSYGIAETVKVYYDNQVLYSATQNPSTYIYA